MKWKNACEAYWWVFEHPKMQYGGWHEPWIEITPHMVNPITKHIDDDPALNTEIRFWVEAGPYCEDEYCGQLIPHHIMELDCGGPTWEEAVFKLANLVKEQYGDYTNEVVLAGMSNHDNLLNNENGGN